MYVSIHVKYPLFLYDFNETKLSRQVFEEVPISNFMKICPVGAEMFHVERRTDGH
jgi:hypothetical protein